MLKRGSRFVPIVDATDASKASPIKAQAKTADSAKEIQAAWFFACHFCHPILD